MASTVEELQLNLEELKKLQDLSTRDYVKTLLTKEIAKVEEDIKIKNKALTPKPAKISQGGATNVTNNLCVVKIINYAWDQSDKFVKLYITLNNVQNQPQDAISTTFTQRSLDFQATVDDKIHCLKIKNFSSDIKPAESYHKVKQDMVILFLRKDQPKKWACVTATEERAKESRQVKPKPGDDEDPSKSIMHLMKQMYDNGDDDMKRTIAKAWSESQDKKDSVDV